MQKSLLWSAVVALGILVTGCTKDKTGGNGPEQIDGEKSIARLTLSVAGLPGTRAAAENSDPASTEETKIDVGTATDADLKVFVFSGGIFENSYLVPLTDNGNGTYTSDPFEILPGAKTFYIFANDRTTNLIATPTLGMSEADFKAKPFNVTYTATSLNIAVNNSFLMGTLWVGDAETIADGGTLDNPEEIVMNIGRLSSKITMDVAAFLKSTSLLGAFSETSYRLGTLAKKINTVGVFTGTVPPLDNPTTTGTIEGEGVTVTSAVNTSANPANAAGFTTSDYVQYSSTTFGTVPIYATENTTVRGGVENAQYYGNTTYVQIETTYAPNTATELYAITTPDVVGATAAVDGSFWYADINGAMKFFNDDPSTVPGLVGTPVKYTGGVMYYKFPVFDTGEEDVVLRNRVLRNHSYQFSAKVVSQLGDPTDDVEPTEPISEPTALSIDVQVLNWDKVTGEVDL